MSFTVMDCTGTSRSFEFTQIIEEEIQNGLSTDPFLTTLQCEKNEIGNKEMEVISKILKIIGSIASIYFINNNIKDNSVKILANALITNKTLTSLDLSSNSIDTEGAEALANALKTNTTLLELNLSNNQIEDQGAEALANALITNKTLTSLDLSGNQVNDEVQRINFSESNETIPLFGITNSGMDDENEEEEDIKEITYDNVWINSIREKTEANSEKLKKWQEAAIFTSFIRGNMIKKDNEQLEFHQFNDSILTIWKSIKKLL